MKSILSVAVLALIGQVPAHKLSQQQRILSNLRYEESEGPTKADNGENEVGVITRESDKNDKSEKVSGWTNPLSWSDTGEDDDQILNMKFKPLDEEYKQWSLPQYEIDEDIDISLHNEKTSEVEVKKQRARWAQLEKEEAEKQAAEEKKMQEKQKEIDADQAKKLKKNLETEGSEKKEKKEKAEEQKAKPQEKKAEEKKQAPKEKPAGDKEQKKEKAAEKAPAEEKKETKEEAKPAAKEKAAPVQKEEGKVVKQASEKPTAAMQVTKPGATYMRLDGEEIEVTDLDDDDEIARQQNAQMVQSTATNVMDYDVDENE